MASLPRVQILLVEDSQDDADLMIDALRRGDLNVHVALVDDGEAALDFLRRRGAHAAAPRPDLVLLDLHLPRQSGLEVLGEIKRDAELRRIPIVVLTSDDREQTFLDAYDLHANCCVAKPVDQEQYSQAVAKIERFWLKVARIL